MDEIRTDPRTHEEAVLDVRYGIRYNELNERFFRKLRAAFTLVNLFAGSAAFAGVVGGADQKVWLAVGGLIIALVTVLDFVIDPAKKIARFNEAFRRMTDLDGRADSLTLEQLDIEWRAIRAQAPLGIEALSEIAYNDNLLSNGRPDCVLALTPWQRVVAGLV